MFHVTGGNESTKSRSVLSRLGLVLVAGLYSFALSPDGFGDDELDPASNVDAFHDSTSPQYQEDCTECHADVLSAESLDPTIRRAHPAMFEFAPGKPGDDQQCRWCHRSIDFIQGPPLPATSKANLRKYVDMTLCTLCHGPPGPGQQFYRVGLKSLVTDGGELYDLVCAACHGPLEDSEVQDEDADKIREAIAENEGGMAPLVALFPEEIDAIADALARAGARERD